MAGVPVSALEHYERAVQKESEGNLGESLKLYRQAFRMDDNVDKAYKEKHFPGSRVAVGKGKDKETARPGVAQAKTEPEPVFASVSAMIESFAGLRIEPAADAKIESHAEAEDEEQEKGFSLLASVPSEILLHILWHVAEVDIAAFGRLTQVSKALCYVVTSEDRIWRDVARQAFSLMPWDWKCSVHGHPIIHEILGKELVPVIEDPEDVETDDVARIIPIDEEEVAKYKSYRDMLRLRPRIRFNGVYISTCNYHRSGGHSGPSLSWNTPVHIVTYYRYLRFYPDGTVLSLLTTHEPADVVYSFSKNHLTPAHLGGLPSGGSALSVWAEQVSRGRWRMDPEGRVDVEVEVPKMDRYLFRMQLRIGAGRAGGMKKGSVKLGWEGFWSWNKLTDDLATFEGRHDKPFWFSRVGSFGKV